MEKPYLQELGSCLD